MRLLKTDLLLKVIGDGSRLLTQAFSRPPHRAYAQAHSFPLCAKAAHSIASPKYNPHAHLHAKPYLLIGEASLLNLPNRILTIQYFQRNARRRDMNKHCKKRSPGLRASPPPQLPSIQNPSNPTIRLATSPPWCAALITPLLISRWQIPHAQQPNGAGTYTTESTITSANACFSLHGQARAPQCSPPLTTNATCGMPVLVAFWVQL